MRRALLVVGSAVLVIAGCSEPDTSAVATFEPSGTGGNGGLLEGRVVLTDDCVYVESRGKRMLPVFPNDQVERGTGEPLTYHDKTYEDGDPISLGGGMVAWPFEDATVPDGCEDDLEVWGVIQG